MKSKKSKNLEAGFNHPNHAKPRTRREFMAQGLLGSTGFVMAPTVLGLMESKAFGLECNSDAPTANLAPAFLCFDLAGGGNIAGGNVMVGKKNGQSDFITDYSSLGVPMGMHPKNAGQTNSEFGLMFHSRSAFLKGMLATTTAATRAKTDGFVMCAASADDANINPFNPTYWINKAGAKGSLTSLVGSANTDSGGFSISPTASKNPAARPVRIVSPAEAQSLVRLGKLADILNTDNAKKILKAVESMSASHLAKFQQKDLPDQIRDLVQCGYIKSSDMITQFTPESVNPSTNTALAGVFNGIATNPDERAVATMLNLMIKGFVGAATFQKGGFDYHDGTRATGETRDEQAGQLIGKSLEAAALSNRDLTIYVFTDGGVFSSGAIDSSTAGGGKGVWTGDSGVRSATFMLHYSAAGRVKISNPSRQIGFYKDNGSVDTAATKISDDVTTMTKAVVANYLALSGREGDLAKVVGDDPFGADLGEYLMFTKDRG